MMLYWKIRYLDRNDRQFKDRWLFLQTETLDAPTKAAIEFVAENYSHRSGSGREILKFRHLFRESDVESQKDRLESYCEQRGVGPFEYFEDEAGNEMKLREMGPILTGSPTAVLVPSGAKQHDIDFMLAEEKPIPIAEANLSSDEVRLLAYFVRDLLELQDSAIMKDGPGKIIIGGTLPALPNGDYHLQTAVTDDEIRSFVTIFRRLYMAKEPANFLKAADLFEKALGSHSFGKWVRGVAEEYEAHLSAYPESRPFMQGAAGSFTVRRLIDVFLYTQYAHQPDEKRQRQFNECLRSVNGRTNFLTWLFLTNLWQCSLEMSNAGRVIAGWFARYCDHHGITPDVVKSLRQEQIGLGAVEKEHERNARLFREKVEELELELWRQAGKPEGGPVQFRLVAQEQLKRALDGVEAFR